ncbi:MAG: response regulator transcription factor, partial [Caldilineaceae bacterium]|nr:response regulator transcription factor [Caldilineaceae bacterium]
MNGKKILVIDDDVNLCQIVKFAFGRHGADVVVARDGREGLQKLYQHRPDLVILDIRMPDMDGWETCRQIRLVSSVPIIMLTNVNRDEEVVRALDHGADDFVTKPFSQEVLIARARAVLRRGDLAEEEQSPLQFQDDHLLIDLDKRQIYVEGEPVRLTATEYRLLSYLLRNANQVLTYDAIL